MLDIPLQPLWKIHADLLGFLKEGSFVYPSFPNAIAGQRGCVGFLIGPSTLHMRRQGNGIAGGRSKEERISFHRNECGTEHDDRFRVISV
jgi:hypothetical protein